MIKTAKCGNCDKDHYTMDIEPEVTENDRLIAEAAVEVFQNHRGKHTAEHWLEMQSRVVANIRESYEAAINPAIKMIEASDMDPSIKQSIILTLRGEGGEA